MRVEIGAPVVLVAGVDTLWHIPAEGRGATVCGFAGDGFVITVDLAQRLLAVVDGPAELQRAA